VIGEALTGSVAKAEALEGFVGVLVRLAEAPFAIVAEGASGLGGEGPDDASSTVFGVRP
jgi:hypothetical protein